MRDIISPLDGFRSPFGPQRGFNPARLFGPTDTGWIYDLSDMSTLFQDAAGTTLVTDFGQPMGLCLDKSKGLVLGPELVTNGGPFVNTTGWTAGLGSIDVVGNAFVLTCATNGRAVAPALTGLVIGNTYQIVVSGVGGDAGIKSIRITTNSDGATGALFTQAITGTSISYMFVATATTHYLALVATGSTGQTFSITGASIKLLPGNHRSQSISLNRPTYARHPLGGIRNLLTFTEEFDDAYWTKDNSSVTANTSAAPDGTNTADLLYPLTTGIGRRVIRSFTTEIGNGIYTASAYLKAAGKSFASLLVPQGNTINDVVWFNLATGQLGTVGSSATSATIADAGNGWYRCVVTGNYDGSGAFLINVADATGSNSVTASGTDGILIWGAQLELGSTATPYQRVGSAFDVTEAGQPDLYYLSYDGLNDSLSTAPFAWGGDKATICAGARKLSDAAGATVVELSTTVAAVNGAMQLAAPSSSGAASFGFRSRGTVLALSDVLSAVYAAPITSVLTGIGDISGDRATLRVDGTQVAQATTDQGTGNFGTHQAFFGARAGTSLFFNGREYSQFAINRLLTANELSQIERYTAQRTGVTL